MLYTHTHTHGQNPRQGFGNRTIPNSNTTRTCSKQNHFQKVVYSSIFANQNTICFTLTRYICSDLDFLNSSQFLSMKEKANKDEPNQDLSVERSLQILLL